MTGNPIDPIWFSIAVKEIFHRLAASEGIDLNPRDHDPGCELSSDEELRRQQLDERLSALRDEAHMRLWGLVLIGDLRAWLGDGEQWARPTEQLLKSRLTVPPDEPIALYVDRTEVDAVMKARYSAEWPQKASDRPQPINQSAPRARGRRRGSGTFAESDALILLEMRALVESGEEVSVTAAARRLAPKARGSLNLDSREARLRKAYFAKWPPGA